MEGLSESLSDLVVYVHPSQTKNVRQAILRELSSLLFKYNEIFNGVVVAYKVNAVDKRARILPGVHPYVAVNLSANLLTFLPKANTNLEGKVVKVSRESIHVIVLGFASAYIMDQDIRQEFRYRHKHGEGMYVSRSQKRHVIKVGTMIRFMVKSWDEEVLHISGSLIPSHTGSISWLAKYFETDSVSLKRKVESEKETRRLDNHISAGGGASSVVNDSLVRMKKRRLSDD